MESKRADLSREKSQFEFKKRQIEKENRELREKMEEITGQLDLRERQLREGKQTLESEVSDFRVAQKGAESELRERVEA